MSDRSPGPEYPTEPPAFDPPTPAAPPPQPWAAPGHHQPPTPPSTAPWGAPQPPPPPGAWAQRWAPPEPLPPPPRKRRKVLVLLVTAALLVAALGVLSIALSGSDDDDAAQPAASGPVAPAAGPQVSGGGVTVSMPAGWVGADVSAGTEGVPAQLFPDDPEVANHVATTLSFLPRAVVILGLDEESARARDPFVDNMSVLLDVSVPDGMPLDDVLDAQTAGIDAFGAEVLDSELIDLGGREVGRVQSRFSVSGFSYETVSYIIIVDTGETYVLTFSFDDVGADDVVLADGSALTFTVG